MIRRDIFAVKEMDRSQADGWCFVYMTTDRGKASRRAAEIRANHTLGIIRQSRVVHPSQFIVNAFVAAGNTID